MAKRKSGRASDKTAKTVDRRVVALAEQLGRLVGTVRGKADRIAGRGKSTAKPSAAARVTGRSGGVVDAPGKKHRKPVKLAAPVNIAKAQAAKVRNTKSMAKTKQTRGRG